MRITNTAIIKQENCFGQLARGKIRFPPWGKNIYHLEWIFGGLFAAFKMSISSWKKLIVETYSDTSTHTHTHTQALTHTHTHMHTQTQACTLGYRRAQALTHILSHKQLTLSHSHTLNLSGKERLGMLWSWEISFLHRTFFVNFYVKIRIIQ